MSLEIPKLQPNNLATARGVKRMTGLVAALLAGEYPAIHIPRLAETTSRPRVRGPDVTAVSLALDALGFNIISKSPYPTSSAEDVRRHIDYPKTRDSIGYYPKFPAMLLRRHTAVRGRAQVAFNTTRHAPYSDAGFKHDPAAPTYKGVQQPGDSLYFVSLGGIYNDTLIPPAEHKFQTVGETARRIHVLDFDFTPVESSD